MTTINETTKQTTIETITDSSYALGIVAARAKYYLGAHYTNHLDKLAVARPIRGFVEIMSRLASASAKQYRDPILEKALDAIQALGLSDRRMTNIQEGQYSLAFLKYQYLDMMQPKKA